MKRMLKITIAAFLFSASASAFAQVPAVNSGTATYPASGVIPTTTTATKLLASVVGSLPTCNGAGQGLMYLATDLLTPTALGVAIGGGAVIAPVVCNGTNWVTVL